MNRGDSLNVQEAYNLVRKISLEDPNKKLFADELVRTLLKTEVLRRYEIKSIKQYLNKAAQEG